MDEGKLRNQAQRKQQADRLLNDPLLQEAFEKTEETILTAWKNSRGDDEEGRNNAYLTYRLLQNFKAYFEATVRNGKAAEKELLSLKDKKKFLS